MEVGVLSFKFLDSEKYMLYKLDNSTVYYKYNENIYKIKIPQECKGNYLDITFNLSADYLFYISEIKRFIRDYNKYPIGFYNNSTNKFIRTEIEFPEEYISFILK